MVDETDEIDKVIEKNDNMFEPTLEKLRKKLAVQHIIILDNFVHPRTGIKFKYVNPKTNIPVECSKGHQWFTTYDNIIRGYGCQRCHLKNVYQKGLQEAKKYNKQRTEDLKELRRLRWEARQQELKEKNYTVRQI